jgi:hypothetical protein
MILHAASVGEIAHRRTEKEQAEALFPPRATTTAADSLRDCASGKPWKERVFKNTSDHSGLRSPFYCAEF